jgi:NADH dehydrogenase
MKHVVVIGGGLSGQNLVSHLARAKDVSITLVDRNNYCFFPPLLYQVATGFLEPSNIAYPFRKMFRKHPNIAIRMAELLQVIPDRNTVVLSTGEIKYDELVIAAGVSTNYFGMKNIQDNALPMKTLSDALRLRNHMLEQVEQASVELSDRERTKYLTAVIAGNGPTGVELAGMLADMQRDILYRDHPELKAGAVRPRIILVDGNDRVLSAMSGKTSAYANRSLSKMGIEIRFGLFVKDYSDGKVVFSNGDSVETKTLIWAAGIGGQRFAGLPADVFGPGGRIKVDALNQVIGLNNIYAIGDACLQAHEAAFPKGHPQMAQVAIQQGQHLARNLRGNDPGKPFVYFNKGTMAIIGRSKAVVEIPHGPQLHGIIAWLTWWGVHLVFLMRQRNRITTFYNWAVAWFTKDQSLRMIVRPSREKSTE